MKKASFIFTICLVLTAVSCRKNFLERENPNQITASGFFETPEQLQQSVNTLYPAMTSVRLLFEQNARGMDAVLTSGAFDVQIAYFNFQSTPESGATDELWNGIYQMIYRANTILANIDKPDWSGNEELKETLNAEIHFFRGVGYFYLAHMYGKVPIVLQPPVNEEDFHPANANSEEEVYEQAVNDLIIAKNGLPLEQEATGRATKGAATGFLGKTYLFRATYLNQEQYKANAAAEFEEVMDMGIYQLVENYQENFTDANENNVESLYEIQLGFNNGIGTPTQDRPFNSVPGIGFEIFLRPAPWLMSEMAEERNVNGGYDIRYLETVYFHGGLPLFGVPYNELGDGLSCEGGNGVGGAPDGSSSTDGGWWRKYLNVNYSCEPAITNPSENNERILRYADILLMYAEAVAESDPAAANDALTQVRSRANLPVRTFAGTALMNEIKHQRLMEFAYENMRYFDLIRWNTLGDEIQTHGTAAQKSNYDQEKHKYFPIPIDEVNNNDNLEQNEAWQ